MPGDSGSVTRVQPLPTSRAVSSARYETLAVAAIGLALFTLGLGNQEFTGFEVRFGIFAQEMLRNGPTLFPTTYGQPYPDYPALSTLFIWVLAHLFRHLDKLVAVLPTALSSATTLALTYRLVRFESRQWAVLAVCFELLTISFLAAARSISIDQMLTTVTLGCFYLLYRQYRLTDPPRSTVQYPALFGLLLLGFCLRGPMGIIVPAGVICSFYLVNRDWRSLLIFGPAAGALLAVAVAGLYWLSSRIGGGDLAREVIWMEVAGRLSGPGEKPLFYYFTSSMGNYALGFVPAVVVAGLLSPRLMLSRTPARDWSPELRLCAWAIAWLLLILLGLSIPEAKKSRYLLPMVPALAILASYPFIARSSLAMSRVAAVLRYTLLVLPGLLLLAAPGARFYAQKSRPDLPVDGMVPILLLALCQVLAIVAWRRHWHRDVVLALAAAAAVYVLQTGLYEPANTWLHRSRTFVRQVEATRHEDPAPLALFNMERDSVANLYLVNADGAVDPVFITTDEQLTRMARPCYLVIADSEAARLTAGGVKLPPAIVSGRFYGDPYRLYYLPGSL